MHPANPVDIDPALLARVRWSRRLTSFIERIHLRGMGRLRGLLARMIVPKPNGPVTIKTDDGFMVWIDPVEDRGVERDIYYYGAYEKWTVGFLRHLLRPGDTFIDVGGNIGYMTLTASGTIAPGGRCYSFEASRRNFEVLSRNLVLNNTTNVEAFHQALGSKEDTATLFDNISVNRGSASFFNQSQVQTGQTVSVIPLDSFLSSRGVNDVTCIKIDVEGWEFEVLRGAQKLLSSETRPALVVEFSVMHPLQGGTHVELYNFIKKAGDYRFFRLKRSKERISQLVEISSEAELPQHDNVFCIPKRLNERCRTFMSES